MALSGSFNTNKYTTSSSGTIGFNLAWTATQSIENNTTTIKWTLKTNGTMGSSSWVYGGPITVTIGGKTVLSVTSRIKVNGDGGYKKTGTTVVTHNEDGTKTVAMSVKAALYSTSVNVTGSKSFALDKINRYALITAVENFDDESNPTIEFTNPAGTDLTTDLKMCMKWKNAGGVDQATEYVDIPQADWAGGSITLNLDSYRANLRSSCPDTTSLAVTFDLQSTMNSTAYHHTKAATMNIVNADPTFTVAPSYQDANPDVVAITGSNQIIVQKQSKLRIYHGTAQGNKGASLMPNPYTLNFNGQGYSFIGDYVEFDKPDIAGTYRAEIAATDTRGYIGSTYIDIVVLDWKKPTADCSLERQNGFDEKCDLTVNAHYSSLGNINTITIKEKHRIKGTQQWSSDYTVPNGQTVEITLNNTYEYEVQITVTDRFDNEVYSLAVGKGIPLFFWDAYRNSIAFNDIPDEDNQFKVGGTLKIKPFDDVSGVVLPHLYSTSEQVVGFWLDGSPIYERTFILENSISAAGGAWTNVNVMLPNMMPLDIKAYNGQSTTWGFLSVQYYNDTLQVFNPRSAAIQFDAYTLTYIYLD